MSYYSMWVMKPFPGKTKDAQRAISAMCQHCKRHGAEETIGVNLFGAAFGHISLMVKFKNMESYGKANDKLVKDTKVQKTLSDGEKCGDVVRQTLARSFTKQKVINGTMEAPNNNGTIIFP